MDAPEYDPNAGFRQGQDGQWPRMSETSRWNAAESPDEGPSSAGRSAVPVSHGSLPVHQGPPRPRPVNPGPPRSPGPVPPHAPFPLNHYNPYHNPFHSFTPNGNVPDTPSGGDYPGYPTPSTASTALHASEDRAAPTLNMTSSRTVTEQPADKQKKRACPSTVDASATKKNKPAPKVDGGKVKAKAKAKEREQDKGKGKAKPKPREDNDDEGEDSSEDDAGPHTGRQTGSRNYSQADINILLDAVQQILPLGADMWVHVAKLFNQRAVKIGRPTREHRPLKTKFEALARMRKPTGVAEIPRHIERAIEIEAAIEEAGAVVDVDDAAASEHDLEVSDDSDVELVDGPPRVATKPGRGKKAGPVLKTFHSSGGTSMRTPTPNRRTQLNGLVSSMSAAFDPAAREAREDSRFARKLVQDEVNRLANENRELRATNERLRHQSIQLQVEIGQLQSRLDLHDAMQRHMPPPSSRPPLEDYSSAPQRSARGYAHSYGHAMYAPCTPPRSTPRYDYAHYPPSPSYHDYGRSGDSRRQHAEGDRSGSYGTSPVRTSYPSLRQDSPSPSTSPRVPSMSSIPEPPSHGGLETLATIASTSRSSKNGSTSFTMLTLTPSRRHGAHDCSPQAGPSSRPF